MQGLDEAKLAERFKGLQKAWKEEGLTLSERAGTWGNSFDAQRLISFARKQGREDAVIEAIYNANHVKNLPLSNWEVLLCCAKDAGVEGAELLLKSDQEVDEVKGKIQKNLDMGINAVPVLIFNDKYRIDGAPDDTLLHEMFSKLLQQPLPDAAL